MLTIYLLQANLVPSGFSERVPLKVEAVDEYGATGVPAPGREEPVDVYGSALAPVGTSAPGNRYS